MTSRNTSWLGDVLIQTGFNSLLPSGMGIISELK